jgi:hypothetical protein
MGPDFFRIIIIHTYFSILLMMMLYVHMQQQSARFPKRHVAPDFLAVNNLAWVIIDDPEPGRAVGNKGNGEFCFKKYILIHSLDCTCFES